MITDSPYNVARRIYERYQSGRWTRIQAERAARFLDIEAYLQLPPSYWPPGVEAWDALWKRPDRFGNWPVTDEAFAAISSHLDDTADKPATLLRTRQLLRIFAQTCHLDRTRRWRLRHPNTAAEIQIAANRARKLVEAVRSLSKEARQELSLASRRGQSALETPHGWLLAARTMTEKIQRIADDLHLSASAPPRGPIAAEHVDNLVRSLAACYDESGSRRSKRVFLEACMTAIEQSPTLLSGPFTVPEMPVGRSLERRLYPTSKT